MITIDKASLSEVADAVARSLSYATVRGGSAFVTTAVTYPNGSAVVVRIDEDRDGYVVTDDGQGALVAETMDGAATYPAIGRLEAARAGLSFEGSSIFAVHVPRDGLPGAVSVVANATSRAVEQTSSALGSVRHKRSQSTFRSHLRSAFGDRIVFDLGDVRGAWRSWRFDAGLHEGRWISALFTFVSPTLGAVASASLKLKDVRSADPHQRLVVALADYEGTEASLRALLSQEADGVVPADSGPDQFRRIAA